VQVEILGLAPQLVDYGAAWSYQRQVHAEVVAGARQDTVLLLEHTPVYTAGKRTNSWDRPLPGGTSTPVVDVDRGGKITWHGPGQLVGYPIVRLADPVDVVAFVRRVEQLLIDACDELGVTTIRVDGRSGVWVPADSRGPERKVAAIGLRVSRGVAMHGFALNVDNDLAPFTRIVPCGIADAGVTTLAAELDQPVGVPDVLPVVARQLPQLVADVPAVARS
jgi:lipoyl(octanoyl) transferase